MRTRTSSSLLRHVQSVQYAPLMRAMTASSSSSSSSPIASTSQSTSSQASPPRSLSRHLSSSSTSALANNGTSTTHTNTISPSEISHFSSLAAHWWDPSGEFKLLHRMNPARTRFMRETIRKAAELPEEEGRWLSGKKVLDVGCGGGIFAEAIARLGADTTAIDASEENIKVAKLHSEIDPSFSRAATTNGKTLNQLEYRFCAAEDLVKEGKKFDVVCAMEVVEHVEDARGFLDCLCDLTEPGGHLLLSTISRTALANFLTITMAESILRFVTPGTHTYHKFIKPEELSTFFEEKGWGRIEIRGCVYDPLLGGWRLLWPNEFLGMGEKVNYFAGVRKPLE